MFILSHQKESTQRGISSEVSLSERSQHSLSVNLMQFYKNKDKILSTILHMQTNFILSEKKCDGPTTFTSEKRVGILENLRKTWFTEKIAKRSIEEERLSFNTIYLCIYNNLVQADSEIF